MELIINFYKELDTLNLIIFWGIIIVIILLLVFSFLLINKNKKLKRQVTNTNTISEPVVPIKTEITESKEVVIKELEQKNDSEIIMPEIPPITKEKVETDRQIEIEKKFVAEEHIMKYNKESTSMLNKQQEEATELNIKKPLEIPTGPYQRNLLREMSLSQTSPIGINRPVNKEEKKIEIAKDLETSLNTELKEDIVKKELKNIETSSPRKTEINFENKISERIKEERGVEQEVVKKSTPPQETIKNKEILIRPSITSEEKQQKEALEIREVKSNIIETKPNYNESKTLEQKVQNDAKYYARELVNIQPQVSIEQSSKTSNAKYLEEVSRKLAAAETVDEVERTDYELEQEENAIISYKELMAKKDSIQTIDEEDAVISIEELMNRNKTKQEEITESLKEDARLYKLSDEEENDDFIKELKQFRNDL